LISPRSRSIGGTEVQLEVYEVEGPVLMSPLGDKALLVTLSHEISEEVNEIVLQACHKIEAAGIPGVEEAQPAYSSFCVHFDPSRVNGAWLGAYAKGILKRLAESGSTGDDGLSSNRAHGGRTNGFKGREIRVPVKYGGDDGPDLPWASEYLGMHPGEIVRRHARPAYRVYMIGFSPGFPYLGGLDPELAMPRTPAPRASVPPGSVGIAGRQTGIYPWESPGGWRIIGRTPLKLFDPARENPSLLHPGDTVRFVPVEEPELLEAWDGLSPEDKQLPAAGSMQPGGLPGEGGLLVSVPAFEVERPGLFSIIVDDGRRGYRKLGVPLSGAADVSSYALANLLCGNKPKAPALEMTLWGARLKALIDVVVAVTGAPCPVNVDGRPFSMNEPVRISAGSVVEIGSPPKGCRMYLAVSGGFSVPPVLGSASTYTRGSFGGFLGRPLRPGDVLDIGPGAWHRGDERISSHVPRNLAGWPERLSRSLGEEFLSLRIIAGPESSTERSRVALDSLCGRAFTVRNDSDRMGIRLEGKLPEENVEGGDILSSPVVPGVLQLPSDGSPVLLLHDAQTSGGYRRIAVVVDEDLPLAAQLRPGSRVRFTCVAP
jgi:KipI family sensor histidine kinase inhibitor